MPIEPLDIIMAIRYAKHVKDDQIDPLTEGEIISLHQHIGLRKPIPVKLTNKVNHILKRIATKKWEMPDMRYNQEMALEMISGRTKVKVEY